jgi:AcrR family transcriptional regulator
MATTRTRSTAEERREQVLAAAVSEFAARGLEAATTADIARRAGISQAYVFRLFTNKRALFLAAIDSCFGRVERRFRDAAAEVPADDAAARLEAMGNAYGELLVNRELLLLQMQAYAASSDEEVRVHVRTRFLGLWALVARLSGADGQELQKFFAHGMLMNVAAALDYADICSDKGWPAVEEQH